MAAPRPWRRAIWAVALLGCLLTWAATWHRTPTVDEPRHLQMGRQVLTEGDWSRFDNSKMPVSALNALPTLLLGPPRDAGPEVTHRDWFWPRLPQALWLLGCTLLAARWAERSWGPRAGLVAAAFVALDPNLQAHAGLVTTDLPCTFFVLATLFSAWWAVESGTWRAWAVSGATLGLAQAAKFTAVFLVPILALALPAALIWRWSRERRWGLPARGALAFVAAGWLALNAAYGFQGTLTPAADIAWRSRLFQPLAEVRLSIAVPRPWIEGLDWVRGDDEIGPGNVYADGGFSAVGQADHYLRAATRKLTLPLMALGVLGLCWPRRQGREALFLAWPMVFLLGWFSLAFNFQIGVRYLLPLLPLLALAAARLPWRVGLVGAALAGISGLTWFPLGLSYQNERLLHRVEAWRHLADSDLDWGQEGLALAAWQAEHPQGAGDADVPALGPTLVGANRLVGVWGDPVRFACLREYLPPAEAIAVTWYAYDLSAEDVAPCFPRRTYRPGEGTWRFTTDGKPALLVARVRGPASLTLGAGEPLAADAGPHEEHLLGVVVDAPAGEMAVSVEGWLQGLYLDGRPHPDAPYEDR